MFCEEYGNPPAAFFGEYYRQVFCKDCKYLNAIEIMDGEEMVGSAGSKMPFVHICNRKILDPVTGEERPAHSNCLEQNKNLRCKYFEFKDVPKKPEEPKSNFVTEAGDKK